MNPFAEYRVTSPFGWRNDPFTGERAFHTGIDLVKSHQAPIYAFTAGEVIHAKEGAPGSGFGGFGIVVAILDKYGSLHCYCHLDMAAVKVGQYVQQGQMVGRQGNTGRSTGSHLHYEVRKTHSPKYGWQPGHNHVYDPGEYLKQYYKKEEEKMKEKQTPSWAVEAQKWVVEQGISDGQRPNDTVTRAEVWTMLYRFAQKTSRA